MFFNSLTKKFISEGIELYKSFMNYGVWKVEYSNCDKKNAALNFPFSKLQVETNHLLCSSICPCD